MKTIAIILSLLSACSSTPKQTDVAHLSEAPSKATGAYVLYKLKAEAVVAADGCTLELATTGSVKTFSITLKPGGDLTYVELPAGEYGFNRLMCGHGTWALTNNKWPAFHVYEGKNSLIRPMLFDVDGARHLKMALGKEGAMEKVGKSLLKKLNVADRPKLVSGYSGQAITN